MSAPGFALSGIDLAIICGSLVVSVAVGLWAARGRQDTAGDYFLASKRLPWWIIGTAFVSTSVSSEQIVGTVGAAYRDGMAIANWELYGLLTYIVMLGLFFPIYLRNRIATVPEYLARRFGPLCSDIYSWVMLVAYVVVFQTPVLYGSTLVLSQLTGWNFYLVLWGTVALIAGYAVKGGLASVMWTDAVQCVMLLGGGITLFFVALARIPGGWPAMVAASPERFHLYHPPSDPVAPYLGLVAGSFGVFLFYSASNQVLVQRVLAARTTWDGLMGIVFSGFINLFRPLVTCFLGFIVYHWVTHLQAAPPLKNPDDAFPFALSTFASGYGLRGIILAGFLAAVMSTVSALANSTATIFALGIYQRALRPQAGDREVVRVGRIASVLALVIASLLCPFIADLGGIFTYFQTSVTMLATPFVAVFLVGMLWRRANYAGALFGIIGGLVIQCGVAFGAPALGIELHWLYSAFIAQVIVMAGVVIVSLATPPPPQPELVAPLVWKPALVANEHMGAGRPWYQNVWLWLGIYGACEITVYWMFW
ncbi:MAG: sodium/solute symporter [Opitutaceae bacterium]|nr:sodium/solute symporter [Opitutaceae bacterium]